MQEFITRMYVKQLLRHPASKVLLAVLLVVNAITIALRTNSMLGQVGLQPDPCSHSSHRGQGKAPPSLGLRLLIFSRRLGWMLFKGLSALRSRKTSWWWGPSFEKCIGFAEEGQEKNSVSRGRPMVSCGEGYPILVNNH